MEQTENFKILINYISTIDKISNNPLIIEANSLNDFKHYLKKYKEEALSNSNTENDALRKEYIKNDLQSMLNSYFQHYYLEYQYLKNENTELYNSYENSFIELNEVLKNQEFNIEEVLTISTNITTRKEILPDKYIYTPIISLNKSPLTRNSLLFCFALNFINIFHNSIEGLQPQPIVKQKEAEEAPKTFDELFYNTALVTPSIDILKELYPPLIDTDCNYIGKLKGVICVWIDELTRQGIVKSNYPEQRKLLAALIPQKIKRFSIDESMFGKYQNKAENLYRTDIKTKVSKIKLSQNSH